MKTADRDWVSLIEYDFTSQPKMFHCDTRDFHIISNDNDSWDIDNMATLKKYPAFFYTIDEIKNILLDLYTKSGGEGEWRMLSFNGDGYDMSGWDCKYIRAFKTEQGYTLATGSRERNDECDT